MSIIHKYWLREFIKFFLIVQVIVLCIFVCIDYLSNINKFLKFDFALLNGFKYVALKIPFMLVQLTPASIIIAVIVVFGLMNKNNEIIALKASGISIYYLIKPCLYSGIFLGFFIFFIGESIVPVTMSKVNQIRYSDFRNNTRAYTAKEDVWLKQDNNIIRFKYFNYQDKTVSGISLFFFNDDFTIKTRIEAELGKFENKVWHFSNVLQQDFNEKSRKIKVKLYDKKSFKLNINPKDLEKIVRKSNELSFVRLKAYIKKIEKQGYDATIYKVDFWGKTAFPFICVIMAITGAAIGMGHLVKQNMSMGIGLGIGISFSYWIIYGFCMSLGYGKFLYPFVGAWTVNLFFICFSIIYLINVE